MFATTLTTHVDFAVRAKALRTEAITQLLGVQPTRAFQRGDEYIGKQKGAEGFEFVKRSWSFGVWHFSTTGLVASTLPHEHALFLLEKLEPALTEIQNLCMDPDYYVKITIWYVGPGGFYMPADVLRRLALICEDVAITCWDTEEE